MSTMAYRVCSVDIQMVVVEVDPPSNSNTHGSRSGGGEGTDEHGNNFLD